MEILASISTDIWHSLAPTTWAVMGLMVSFYGVKKLLFG